MKLAPLEGAFIHGAVSLACSIVICVGIVGLYCFMTNSWSILAPQPRHRPVVQFCSDGTFGNACWE
jgi:hypothetical protein